MPKQLLPVGAFLILGALTCTNTTPPLTTTPEETSSGPETDDPVILHEAGIENAYPRLSADGSRILYQSNRTGKWQLFIMDIATGGQQHITNDEHNNNFVDWCADNAWVAFVSDRDGNEEIYRMRADGSERERLTVHAARDIHP